MNIVKIVVLAILTNVAMLNTHAGRVQILEAYIEVPRKSISYVTEDL